MVLSPSPSMSRSRVGIAPSRMKVAQDRLNATCWAAGALLWRGMGCRSGLRSFAWSGKMLNGLSAS